MLTNASFVSATHKCVSEQSEFAAPSFSVAGIVDAPNTSAGAASLYAQFINETSTPRKRAASPDQEVTLEPGSTQLATKRPRGRPPGTGHKQRQQHEETPNGGTASKRPVGRPKKQPQSTFASVPSKYKLTGLVSSLF